MGWKGTAVTALSVEMLKALEAAGDSPPRVLDPRTRELAVLLKAADFDWIRDLLGDEPDVPRLSDPRNQDLYAVVPTNRYERFKAFFEEDPLSAAERSALLREAGRRAGWDDAAWNDQTADNRSREGS